MKSPTSMAPHAWGGATHHCLQLPPQSGILYLTHYLGLIVDDFFLVLTSGQARLCISLASIAQRIEVLSLCFSLSVFSFLSNILVLLFTLWIIITKLLLFLFTIIILTYVLQYVIKNVCYCSNATALLSVAARTKKHIKNNLLET
jgi:hypothetical protein